MRLLIPPPVPYVINTLGFRSVAVVLGATPFRENTHDLIPAFLYGNVCLSFPHFLNDPSQVWDLCWSQHVSVSSHYLKITPL